MEWQLSLCPPLLLPQNEDSSVHIFNCFINGFGDGSILKIKKVNSKATYFNDFRENIWREKFYDSDGSCPFEMFAVQNDALLSHFTSTATSCSVAYCDAGPQIYSFCCHPNITSQKCLQLTSENLWS